MSAFWIPGAELMDAHAARLRECATGGGPRHRLGCAILFPDPSMPYRLVAMLLGLGLPAVRSFGRRTVRLALACGGDRGPRQPVGVAVNRTNLGAILLPLQDPLPATCMTSTRSTPAAESGGDEGNWEGPVAARAADLFWPHSRLGRAREPARDRTSRAAPAHPQATVLTASCLV